MALEFSAKYTAKDVQKKVKAEPLWTKKDGEKVAAAEIKVITDRAARGDGVDGQDMPALSPAYAKKKQEKVGNARPNLRLTGAMLGALDSEVTDRGVRIGVPSSFDGQVAGLEADGRTFLGISREDLAATEKVFQEILDGKDLIPVPDMTATNGKTTTRTGAGGTYRRTV